MPDERPENEEPFEDNPILAARRVAFDAPTHANLAALTEACHVECWKEKHKLQMQIKDLKAAMYDMAQSWASTENVLCERSGGTPDPDLARKLYKGV